MLQTMDARASDDLMKRWDANGKGEIRKAGMRLKYASLARSRPSFRAVLP